MARSAGTGGGGSPLLKKALITLAVLLGLSISVDTESLFPLLRGGEAAANIVHRSQEYQRAVAANDALETEVQYLRTREGGKWAVYRYQGLVEPGQQVGRLVEAAPPAASRLTQPQRMRNWILATETAGAQMLRGFGQVLLCYGGLRPMDQPPPKRNQPARPVSNQPLAGVTGSAGASARVGSPPS